MIDVALDAALAGSLGRHLVVEILRILLEIGMAGQASVRHFLAAKRHRVAARAAIDLGVGAHTSKDQPAGLCIERAGAEQYASLGEADSGNKQHD